MTGRTGVPPLATGVPCAHLQQGHCPRKRRRARRPRGYATMGVQIWRPWGFKSGDHGVQIWLPWGFKSGDHGVSNLAWRYGGSPPPPPARAAPPRRNCRAAAAAGRGCSSPPSARITSVTVVTVVNNRNNQTVSHGSRIDGLRSPSTHSLAASSWLTRDAPLLRPTTGADNLRRHPRSLTVSTWLSPSAERLSRRSRRMRASASSNRPCASTARPSELSATSVSGCASPIVSPRHSTCRHAANRC